MGLGVWGGLCCLLLYVKLGIGRTVIINIFFYVDGGGGGGLGEVCRPFLNAGKGQRACS